MAKEYSILVVVVVNFLDMKVNGRRAGPAKEPSTTRMGINTSESGRCTKNMDLELYIMQMVHDMKGIGIPISNMAKGLTTIKMGINTEDSGVRTKDMDLELCIMQMVHDMKGNGIPINNRAKEKFTQMLNWYSPNIGLVFER